MQGVHFILTPSNAAGQAPENQQAIPTLFVGLGGSGKEVVMRLRKRFYDRDAKTSAELPFTRFLVLDTDDQPGSQIPQDEPSEAYQPVLLGPDEFVRCQLAREEIQGAFERMRHQRDPRFVSWLKPELENEVVALESGAGTFRQFGRLAFFLRYRDVAGKILSDIRTLLRSAANPPAQLIGTTAQVDPTRLEVVVITSLAGGTGSGMFIDICYLIKDILSGNEFGQLKSKYTTLLAFMPAVFEKDGQSNQRHQQNAYAALLEMEYYRTPRSRETFLHNDELEPVGFRVNWEGAADAKWIKGAGWDTCYLLDNVNNLTKNTPLRAAEVFQMAADYLFLDFENSAFATAKRSARSNHVQYLDRTKWTTIDRSEMDGQVSSHQGLLQNEDVLFATHNGCTFSSFGLSTIEIDANRVQQAAAYRLAARLLRDYWLGDSALGAKIDRRQPIDWAKEDLGEARQLAGVTEPPPSFKSTALLERLYRTPEGENWLHRIPPEFQEALSLTPPTEAADVVKRLLAKHPGLLKTAAHADDAGKAIQALEQNYKALAGTPQVLGALRTRLKQLLESRVSQFGVTAAFALLEAYQKALTGEERIVRQWAQGGAGGLLDRLSEAMRLPGFVRNRAVRIELRRAGIDAEQEVHRMYRQAGAKYVEKLILGSRSFIGSSNQARDGSDMQQPLFEYYKEITELLKHVGEQLEKRFKNTCLTAVSDRKNTLLPPWTDDEYDQRINAAVLRQQNIEPAELLVSPFRFDWARLSQQVLGALVRLYPNDYVGVQRLSDLVDLWHRNKSGTREGIVNVAENIADACRQALLPGVDLRDFAEGSVCDLLMRDRDSSAKREFWLKKLVDYSACYLPSVGDTKIMHDFEPAFRNIFGEKASDADSQHGNTNARAIEQEVKKVSQSNGTTKRDQIADVRESTPSSLIICREMAGFPLQYYYNLDKLHDAYHAVGLGRSVEECHLDYHESWEDLPDIRYIAPEGYAEIRDNIEAVLRGVILGVVIVDGAVFSAKVPDRIGVGVVHIRLGKRLDRVIKHACEHAGARQYIARRWSEWQDRAKARDWAALFVSVQKTYQELPTGDYKIGQRNLSSPARNCFRLLFESTSASMAANPEARAWYDILDPRKGHPARDAMMEHVARVCLRRVSPQLPIYQLDDRGLENLEIEPPANVVAGSPGGT